MKILILPLILLVSCGNPHLKPVDKANQTSDFQEIVYDFESDTGFDVGEVEHKFVDVDSEDLFLEENGVLIINKKLWNETDNTVRVIEVYRVLADGYKNRPETEIATMPGKISCPRSLMHPKMRLFSSCFTQHKGYYIDELRNGEDLSDLKE
jgi:hypothetical protein